MFVVCFGDGLGNQMFQYAFYKALIKHYPENEVYMDIFRIYGKHIHNGFELSNVFGIQSKEAQLAKVLRLADYWPNVKLSYKVMNKIHALRRYLFGKKMSHISEDDPTAYYPEVFSLSTLQSYLFCGNWVNEQYFHDCKMSLIKDFTFPELTDERNMQFASLMRRSESVSVHIRKGDYVNSPMLNLSIGYYKLAKKKIEEKIDNPQYFIFTDDKNAIEEYLALFENGIVVTGNFGKQSFKDMQLMSICKNNIIANSTFSFWGAYLNKNSDKLVVAPNKAKFDFRNPFACPEWTIIPFDGEEVVEV